MRLIVSVTGIEPGAPLDAATVLADELDARRVPLTLLVGPRPHPEVVAWAAARRRAGDAVLLHGTAVSSVSSVPSDRHRGESRLPAHEAGLRLAGAARVRDALGLPVDGYAAPGWHAAEGVRRALGIATPTDLSVLVAADGVHRLGPDGAPLGSSRGPVTAPDAPAPRESWATRAARHRPSRRRERTGCELVHVTAVAGRGRSALLATVDGALAAGALPGTPAAVVPAGRAAHPGAGHDPELWSITA